MSFYQIFQTIDTASLGMNKEERSIIIKTFFVSDEALNHILDFEDGHLRNRENSGHN